MNGYLWTVAGAEVYFGKMKLGDRYQVLDAERRVILGPLSKAAAETISAAHNDAVMAMMELVNEAKTPRPRYEGMGA